MNSLIEEITKIFIALYDEYPAFIKIYLLVVITLISSPF